MSACSLLDAWDMKLKKTSHKLKVLGDSHMSMVTLIISLSLLQGSACGQSGAPEDAVADSSYRVLLRAEVQTAPDKKTGLPQFGSDKFEVKRKAMVTQQIEKRGVKDQRVLHALRRVPRHEFVPASERSIAYEDYPLPIGHGQTISQPYIVGFMTELLQLKPGDTVLEVGTGSSYQAAILAEIVKEVVSIEIIDALAKSAAKRLERLGYKNITVASGDGYFGWKERATFDAIIVTAAADHIPPPLLRQLKVGGRMAIPVGRTGWTQNLLLVEKQEGGKFITRNILAVRFVALTREKR